jgi:hypothetical protein
MAGDWRALGAAALTKAAGEAIKWYRQPNRVIKEMFNTAEQYHKPPNPTPAFHSVVPTGSAAAKTTLGIP